MTLQEDLQAQVDQLLAQAAQLSGKGRRTKKDTDDLLLLLRQVRGLVAGLATEGDLGVVTNLQVYPVREPQGKLRAYVRVCLGDQLQLTGLKLYDGANGLFISYPSDPNHKGEDYRQLFYPITRALRDHIELAAIAEYEAAIQA